MPTLSLAADSTSQQIATKRYLVPISLICDAQMTGMVEVLAVGKEEAISKVRFQLDNDTVDKDTEMEEACSGITMSYADLICLASDLAEIVESDIEEDDLDEVTLDDILLADIHQLKSSVYWTSETLTKHKAFLESLVGTA